MRWTYKIMKLITSLLGLLCFSSVLYFGVSGGPLPTYNESEKDCQELRDGARSGVQSIKKKKKRVKTQVAIVNIEDAV